MHTGTGKLEYSIRDFGALPDGKTIATSAIQAAIDECSKQGGGTILVPPGEYLTGTVWLRDNVTLFLDSGAVIRGSADKKDYDNSFDRNFLIGGFKLHNVTITGYGTFHGNGELFWRMDQLRPRGFQKQGRYGKKDFRPFSLIQFRESRDIAVSDITIIDSACYAVWILGSDNVRISGVTIRNNRCGPNTDGLDIDCSSNVRVSDCNISGGDDCIAVKSDTAMLGYDKACENLLVTNCQLASSTNGIRVGYEGDGEIKNCVFSNLVIHDSRDGICLDVIRVCNLVSPESVWNIEDGPRISNLIFQNIVMDVQKAIHFWVGIETPGTLKGFIRNILIKDVTARAERGCNLNGHPDSPIEGLVLENIKLIFHGEKDDSFVDEIPYPLCVWGTLNTRGMPYGFFCRYMKNLTFRNIAILWEDISGPWSSAIRCEHVDGLVIRGLTGRQAYADSDQPVIQLRNVMHALVRDSLVREKTSCFVRVYGAGSKDIRVAGNDLDGLVGEIVVKDRCIGSNEVNIADQPPQARE